MKLWAGRFQKETDTLVNDFNSSITFDARLYQEDIEGSIAHAAMLGKQGIIEEHEAEKIIDGLIFVEPRMIPIEVNGEVGECQRPLRAQTAQGERISLANSEEIPAGSTIEFEIVMLDEKAHKEAVLEWLEYGRLRGIGQWRNSGKGRFTYEVLNG